MNEAFRETGWGLAGNFGLSADASFVPQSLVSVCPLNVSVMYYHF